MRYLWYVSWIALLVGCKTSSPSVANYFDAESNKTRIAVFWKSQAADSTLKFITHTTIYGKEINGILFLRRESDSVYKATFLAQGALKLFDMVLTKDSFQVLYSIPDLSKPAVQRTLAEDMKLLTIHSHTTIQKKPENPVSGQNDQFFTFYRNGSLVYETDAEKKFVKMTQTNLNGKKMTSITFSDFKQGIPEKISLQHHRFRMRIELSLMRR